MATQALSGGSSFFNEIGTFNMGSGQVSRDMSLRNWNGSRWWKCDLHTHTPASEDYGKGLNNKEERDRCTPRNWLLGYMRAGIDCVAVTDHNCGDWIDRLKEALDELRRKSPEGFRPLHLFPGVEITVYGNVHLLAILPSEKTKADIDNLLGAVGLMANGKGKVTKERFAGVVEKIVDAGGIAIPAHVDLRKGLFKELTGNTLDQALRCNQVFAMEIRNPNYAKPQLYRDHKLGWTEILCSDSHHSSGKSGERYPGSHYTWLKMGWPSLDGLRLALLDGPVSVRRSDAHPESLNRHAESILESIEVTDTKYMGRERPFKVPFNPWLNTIVGGRGTGKSSLVEFLRIALRREHELPKEFEKEFEMYATVYQNRTKRGLLTEQAKLEVIYEKNGSRFRIQWDQEGRMDAIEEEAADGGWSRAEGTVNQRFPVRMYSQKQIFYLANVPSALLRVVDDSPEVDYRDWRRRWQQEEHRFLSLRLRIREVEAELQEEDRLKGDLDDLKRKLEIFEKSGHAAVLRLYQRYKSQQRMIEIWQAQWGNAGERIRQGVVDFVPDPLSETYKSGDSKEDMALLKLAETFRERLEAILIRLEGIAKEADETLAEWKKELERSDWRKASIAAAAAYESLTVRLAKEGVGDPSEYGALLQRRQLIEQDLDKLVNRKKEVEDLRNQAESSRERLLEIRRDLTEIRRSFLARVLKDNLFVSIQVTPYGEHETVETEFRALIHREDGSFAKDITSLLDALDGAQKDQRGVHEIEEEIEQVKQGVRSIVNGSRQSRDKRFESHLRNLPPEAMDRLEIWFPQDSLAVQYSPKGDGSKFRPIDTGSPGQKTAALLAFLLSYGREPLVLDQPEDDLDNRLIHELIVGQIRKEKQRRQIIVVTHNPNIVVNGDAELVIALAARGGRTDIECEGSLQDKDVRKTICEVMEGGLEALRERYNRITMGLSDV